MEILYKLILFTQFISNCFYIEELFKSPNISYHLPLFFSHEMHNNSYAFEKPVWIHI